MSRSVKWKKKDIIEMIKEGATFSMIKGKFPGISSATVTSYRKKIEQNTKEIELKIEYANRVVASAPSLKDLDSFLLAQWDRFSREAFPLIEKIDRELNKKLENGELTGRDLIYYKMQLLNVFTKSKA